MKTIIAIPTLEHIPSYLEALTEGHRCGADKVKDAAAIAAISSDPQSFLDKKLGPQPATFVNEKGDTVERVPDTPFWFVEGNTFIGDISVRHRLTPVLETVGGHIGYGIRPSYQGKGHATEMLRQSLVWVRENLKIEKVLLTCRVGNEGSSRVIEKNGGELIDVTPHPFAPGEMQKRYWVPVPRKLPNIRILH